MRGKRWNESELSTKQTQIGSGWDVGLLARFFLAGFSVLWLAGCGQIDSGFLTALNVAGLERDDGSENAGAAAGATARSPADLVGESQDAVRGMLGEPQGRIAGGSGVVWLYSGWRIEFDERARVSSVERELSSQTARGGGSGGGVAPAGGRTSGQPVTVISNGGAEVNLGSLLTPGKITVIDFYADWCGPCRQISPHLERLAREDPEVNLVKVDIVKWNTPVTRQYGIRSIPDIRVYDRLGRSVGTPTSSLQQVQRNVAQAKR